MANNTIITSVVNGGSNSHATVSEEANATATDFVSQGVVGAITLNTGSGGAGSFCVNADASPDMGVTVLSGQAYIAATPSSQDAQVLRARASSNYTTYTINANSSGSTKYDWIYLQVSATNANNPASDASNVTSIYTSRSSSNATDNGTPPTYGLLLAVVTVANGASSITNSNITDKRFNTSIGAQNGSLIVTQASTGQPAVIQAAGIDANVDIEMLPKGTGKIKKLVDNLYNPYKFSAYLNGDQTVSASTWTKITLNAELYDTGSNFDDVTNHQFTAPVNGYYQFNGTVFGVQTDGQLLSVGLNVGTFSSQPTYQGGQVIAGGAANHAVTISVLVELTAGNTVQFYVFTAGTTVKTASGFYTTFLTGFLVSAT